MMKALLVAVVLLLGIGRALASHCQNGLCVYVGNAAMVPSYLDDGDPYYILQNSVTFALYGTGGMECRYGTDTYMANSVTSLFTLSDLANGAYVVEFVVYKAADDTPGGRREFDFIVDKDTTIKTAFVEPQHVTSDNQPEFLNKPDDSINNAQWEIDFQCQNNFTGTWSNWNNCDEQCCRDDTNATSFTALFQYHDLTAKPEGSYAVRTRTWLAASNDVGIPPEEEPPMHVFIYDTEAPVITFDAVPPALSNNEEVTLAWTCEDASECKQYCKYDGMSLDGTTNEWTRCKSPVKLTATAKPHAFQVKAVDALDRDTYYMVSFTVIKKGPTALFEPETTLLDSSTCAHCVLETPTDGSVPMYAQSDYDHYGYVTGPAVVNGIGYGDVIRATNSPSGSIRFTCTNPTRLA
eukprot:jgi/Chlat1/4224/Chrsp27S04310